MAIRHGSVGHTYRLHGGMPVMVRWISSESAQTKLKIVAQFPVGKDFNLHHKLQTVIEIQPAYAVGTAGSFYGGAVAEEWC
jgi:hypothetical protein